LNQTSLEISENVHWARRY